MKERHIVEVELARVGDVRDILRARQPLGDPVLAAGGAGKVRPERRVVQHVTPAPHTFVEVDRAER